MYAKDAIFFHLGFIIPAFWGPKFHFKNNVKELKISVIIAIFLM